MVILSTTTNVVISTKYDLVWHPTSIKRHLSQIHRPHSSWQSIKALVS
jgi:hypothetical protein